MKNAILCIHLFFFFENRIENKEITKETNNDKTTKKLRK